MTQNKNQTPDGTDNKTDKKVPGKVAGFPLKWYVILLLGLFILCMCLKYSDGLVAGWRTLKSAVQPLILGCLIAYVVNILMTFYERLYKKWVKRASLKKAARPLCMVLAFVSVAGIIALVVGLMVPQLVESITNLVADAPKNFAAVMANLEKNTVIQHLLSLTGNQNANLDIEEKVLELFNFVFKTIQQSVTQIMSGVMTFFSAVVSFLVGLIFSCYILAGKEKLGRQIRSLMELYLPKKQKKMRYVLHTFHESFHNFIVGQCLEAVILGVLCSVSMLILRFPYALLIGVLVGFTALIPIFGAYIGAGVGALLILTVSPFRALLFLLFIVILQQIEGNVIYPKVVGSSIGLPGIWVLAAVIIGSGTFGIMGVIFAVPIASALYKLLGADMRKRRAKL